jgi:hypothetical protein
MSEEPMQRLDALKRAAIVADARWKRVQKEIGPDPMVRPSAPPEPLRWKPFREGKGWAAYIVHGPAQRKGAKIAEAPEASMLPASVAALSDAVRVGAEYGQEQY